MSPEQQNERQPVGDSKVHDKEYEGYIKELNNYKDSPDFEGSPEMATTELKNVEGEPEMEDTRLTTKEREERDAQEAKAALEKDREDALNATAVIIDKYYEDVTAALKRPEAVATAVREIGGQEGWVFTADQFLGAKGREDLNKVGTSIESRSNDNPNDVVRFSQDKLDPNRFVFSRQTVVGPESDPANQHLIVEQLIVSPDQNEPYIYNTFNINKQTGAVRMMESLPSDKISSDPAKREAFIRGRLDQVDATLRVKHTTEDSVSPDPREIAVNADELFDYIGQAEKQEPAAEQATNETQNDKSSESEPSPANA